MTKHAARARSLRAKFNAVLRAEASAQKAYSHDAYDRTARSEAAWRAAEKRAAKARRALHEALDAHT